MRLPVKSAVAKAPDENRVSVVSCRVAWCVVEGCGEEAW